MKYTYANIWNKSSKIIKLIPKANLVIEPKGISKNNMILSLKESLPHLIARNIEITISKIDMKNIPSSQSNVKYKQITIKTIIIIR